MDLGIYACLTCGSPLRFTHAGRNGLPGLRCIVGIVPRETPVGLRPGVDCDGRKAIVPRPARPRLVEVFRCSGCRREEKVRLGAQLPMRWCECGGMLVFDRAQTR
jgi:hypothetical protein